jgi:hypothetical protein
LGELGDLSARFFVADIEGVVFPFDAFVAVLEVGGDACGAGLVDWREGCLGTSDDMLGSA